MQCSVTLGNDSTIKVTSDEIKARYNEKKDMYKQLIETRDIKYIDVQVVPSEEDNYDYEDEYDY